MVVGLASAWVSAEIKEKKIFVTCNSFVRLLRCCCCKCHFCRFVIYVDKLKWKPVFLCFAVSDATLVPLSYLFDLLFYGLRDDYTTAKTTKNITPEILLQIWCPIVHTPDAFLCDVVSVFKFIYFSSFLYFQWLIWINRWDTFRYLCCVCVVGLCVRCAPLTSDWFLTNVFGVRFMSFAKWKWF